MVEHGDVLGRPNHLRLNQFFQPIHQCLLVKRPVIGAGSLRLVFAHLVWAMAEWHDLPRKPTDDGIDTVKQRWLHCLCEELQPPNGKPMLLQERCRHLLRPEGLKAN